MVIQVELSRGALQGGIEVQIGNEVVLREAIFGKERSKRASSRDGQLSTYAVEAAKQSTRRARATTDSTAEKSNVKATMLPSRARGDRMK